MTVQLLILFFAAMGIAYLGHQVRSARRATPDQEAEALAEAERTIEKIERERDRP